MRNAMGCDFHQMGGLPRTPLKKSISVTKSRRRAKDLLSKQEGGLVKKRSAGFLSTALPSTYQGMTPVPADYFKGSAP